MIKLLISDDHPIVREGLKRIITDCADIQLVGEAVDGHEVLKMCEEREMDVLLLDITMPGPGFLEILRLLKKRHPRIRVLVLSIHPEEHYALRVLKAGASGYLTKDRSFEELESAIRHVYRDKIYVTASLAEKMANMLLSDHHKEEAYENLSEREYQIFRLLGSGKRISDIAAELGLSPKTVSTYRSRIFEKMQFHSTVDLIRYAVEFDIIE